MQILKFLILPVLLILWVLTKLGEKTFQLSLVLIKSLSGLKLPQLPNFNFKLPKPSKKTKALSSVYKSNVISKNKIKKPEHSSPDYLQKALLKFLSLFTPLVTLLLKTILAITIFLVKTPISFFNRRPRRGRPRQGSAVVYNFKRNYKGFKRIVPTPLRVALILVLIISIFFSYSLFLVLMTKNLPSPYQLSDSKSPLTTEIYDRNGKLLYRLYEGKNRTLTDLNSLPKHLVQATIAIEDKNFYAHSGIDLMAVGRAVYSYFSNHQVQGASTITQQLIKNTLLTPERTLDRKIKEVFLAFWVERVFSKNEILQMYFNEVPYGGPAWGIAAAAQTYFNKNVKDLTLAESTYLAGLPASPTTFSPYGSQPELAKMRQKEVLRRMVEEGFITQQDANKTYDEELSIQPPVSNIKAPHFVMYVRQLLSQKYGEKAVSQGGLKVTTTLDLDIQEMAEQVVSDEVANLANLNATNGAAMVTSAKTGEILAMVGSKNYFDEKGGNFNVSTALRQPGSSIKPVTYAAAFKQGYAPGTILLDAPVTFKNQWESYTPVNYDGKFHGAVTIRTALGSSYNIPAVKALYLIGIPEMVKTARDLGITTFTQPDRYGLSLTLGGGEVRLIDMMTVYGTFSQMGTKHEPLAILKIVDPHNNIVEDNQNLEGKKVITPGIAYMVTSILSDNRARTPAFGPNSLLNIPRHNPAVKTGTTDNKRDNWTFGYTPEFVVGTWVGNNNNQPMSQNLASGVTGAAPIWNKIMTNLLAQREAVAFTKPDDISDGIVDGSKDLVLNGQVTKSVVGLGKKKIKDEKSNTEREAITFTDPFSTFVQDSNSKPTQP